MTRKISNLNSQETVVNWLMVVNLTREKWTEILDIYLKILQQNAKVNSEKKQCIDFWNLDE